MAAVVYVKQTCAVGVGGDLLNLRRGQAWDADAPVVRENPDLFEAEPVKVEGRGGVERATSAPGEKRTVGRPRATSATDGAR